MSDPGPLPLSVIMCQMGIMMPSSTQGCCEYCLACDGLECLAQSLAPSKCAAKQSRPAREYWVNSSADLSLTSCVTAERQLSLAGPPCLTYKVGTNSALVGMF